MKLALAQLSSSDDRVENLSRVLDAMDRAALAGAELMIFPELVLDRFFPQFKKVASCGEAGALELAETIPGPSCERVAERAQQHQLVTVFNLFEIDSRGRTFDSSPVFDADGSLLGVTRMVHITDYEGFHEQDYYHPGDRGAPVYDTRVGKIGVAICYDRHYPEYMRALALAGADLVAIPQAGTLDEWPEGLYEAELRTAAFQNGYFVALCNRVGIEGALAFAGESFVVDPAGRVQARAAKLEDDLLLCDVDLAECQASHARQLFFRDRRPELYGGWLDQS